MSHLGGATQPGGPLGSGSEAASVPEPREAGRWSPLAPPGRLQASKTFLTLPVGT